MQDLVPVLQAENIVLCFLAFNFRKNVGRFLNGLMMRDEAMVWDGCF